MNSQLLNQLEKILITPHVFEVVLDEEINQNIYEEFDINETKRTLGNFNHQLVSVISLMKLDEIHYGLFKHGGEIIGWTALADSHYVYPKQMESVKINLETFQTSPFNRWIGIKKDLILALQGRLLTSKSFVEIEGEILEMVFLKGRLQGYVKTEDLDKGIHMDDKCHVEADAHRYRDSNFDADLPLKEQDFEAEIKLYFPKRNLVKLEQGEWTFWMKASDLNYDFKDLDVLPEKVQEDVHYYYKDERAKTKSIIEGLIKRQIRLEREADRAKSRLERVETLYKNLRESKLGRIQVQIWKRKKRSAK